MNLNQALEAIASRFGLNAEDLKAYAQEDTIGGYHTDDNERKWPTGSLWGVDGQILYALTRATQPALVVELGSHYGASGSHLAAALEANDKGELHAVDVGHNWESGDNARVKRVFSEAVTWLTEVKPNSIDLLFEDLAHGRQEVESVWRLALTRVKPGGFIISHDATHFLVGADVRAGIEGAGVANALLLSVEPADTGLAIWRRIDAGGQADETPMDATPKAEPPVKKTRKPRAKKAAK